MEKITFTVQLDKDLHESVSKNADSAQLNMTDYVRLILKSEVKNETILKRLKKIV